MANDFSGDENCVALWRMEDGALTVDSKGGNTPTDSGDGFIHSNTGAYKEGASSAECDDNLNSHELEITDGNLDAGFPLKNGDTTKIISTCFWVRPGPADTYQQNALSKALSFSILISNNYDGKLRIKNYYDGGTDNVDFNPGFVWDENHWYHVGVVHDGVNKTIFARIWDDTESKYLGSDIDTTWANETLISAGMFELFCHQAAGTHETFEGLLDEVVIFKDKLTGDEIDQIRQGIYGAVSLSIPIAMHHLLRH